MTPDLLGSYKIISFCPDEIRPVRPERVNQGIKNAKDSQKPHEISQYHEFSYQIIKKSLTRLSEIILSA